jgi:hypothetical protein
VNRVLHASILANKSFIEAAVLAVLVIAALLLAHQMHHVTAANSGPAVRILGATSPASYSAQSNGPPGAGESFGSSETSQSSGSSTHTSLNVNGQDIPLPANGSVNRTITNGDTTTTITADTSSSSSADSAQGQASSSNNSSVDVRINSNSSEGGP